jgi:hypothetical protein
MKKWIVFCLLFSGISIGNANAEICNDLKECAKVMHEITGQRYVWDATIDNNKLVMVPGMEITKENSEVVFTALLDQVGLARAPIGDGKSFRIVRSSLRKEMELPVIVANADSKPEFSNTWDWVTMRYKTKSRDLAVAIEKAYRLHVPREARLHADYIAGILIVSATTPVVRQMFDTIKAADVPMTPEIKRHLEAQEKRGLKAPKTQN